MSTPDPRTTLRLRHITDALVARTPESDIEPSLERVARAMELLGDPQKMYPIIHLTGTNGKTSTTRMIERILRELGLRTGRFTSPHLHDVRERITVDGEPVDPERFLAVWDDIAPIIAMVDAESEAAGQTAMTYFEVLTVMAYATFADAPVDVAVIEVGLGGGWDATNVGDGQVAVLTPIGVDHERFLGSDVESIATEKVGIIKPGARVISAEQAEEVREILAEAVTERAATLKTAGVDFAVTDHDVAVGGQLVTISGLAGVYPGLMLPLHGYHQAANLALAVVAVESFLGDGGTSLHSEVLREAVAGMTSPGRLEVVRRSPTVLVDAAHNEHGMTVLREAVQESFTFTRLVGLVGVLQEKDAEAMLLVLDQLLDHVVISASSSPRAIPPAELGELAEGIFGSDRVSVVANLPDAVDLAGGLADQDGVGGAVLATGSVTIAADVRMLLDTTEVG